MGGLLTGGAALALTGTAAASDGPVTLLNKKAPADAKADASIRVSVSMALVPVSVLDLNGRNVTGLVRENFRLLDGKEPREIAAFAQEDQPLTVGLIFDCSRSMLDKFAVAREAPAQLYRQLNPGDESFLITVSDSPSLRQGLTTDFSAVENALFFTQPNGSTALLDGVRLGMAQIQKARNPRRALIVVSDGGENNSRFSLGELRKVAMEADVQIFSIGLHDRPGTREEVEGAELLRELARASGGIHYPVHCAEEIAGAMAKIGIALHNQYVLGYYPPADAQAGKYRPITVQLCLPAGIPPLHIYARTGYYTPEK